MFRVFMELSFRGHSLSVLWLGKTGARGTDRNRRRARESWKPENSRPPKPSLVCFISVTVVFRSSPESQKGTFYGSVKYKQHKQTVTCIFHALLCFQKACPVVFFNSGRTLSSCFPCQV